MKVYLDASDGLGWAIDDIKNNLLNSFERLDIQRSKNPLSSDLIHNVWWNALVPIYKRVPFSFNKVLPTAVNFINLDDENYPLIEEFKKVNSIATAWISPSTKQQKIFEKYNIKSYVLPYNIDFSIFKHIESENEKKEIFNKYNLPKELFKDRVVIGSFQRDSLGADLTKPKWQKGPELLIELLKSLPKDKFVLLLAGPRRHYVINECKKYDIPYYYIGNETKEDDILTNALDVSEMSNLYNLCDIYLVTSKSEGGPKAVLESVTTNTFIMSTDTGLASDFIDSKYIFNDLSCYTKELNNFVNDKSFRLSCQSISNNQYKKALSKLSYESMDAQLLNIYNDILKVR